MPRRKNPDRRLTADAAAKRLSISTGDLPDIGHPWTARDVTDALRSRPEWLLSGRHRLAAAQAEIERARQRRFDAVSVRGRNFTWPAPSAEAVAFATEFSKANLLDYLYDALDAAAADTEVWDSGYDVSTFARRVNETNRERAKRGVSLSGRDEQRFGDHGFGREPGTLGDLFDAPNANTIATHVSGAGFAAETWGDAWQDRWSLDGLDLAYVLGDLVLAGSVQTLEVIAGVPLSDVETAPHLEFDDVPAAVLSLARQALWAWTDRESRVLDPDEIVDMDAPLAALPAMLLATRHDWTRTERLALLLAGLDSIERLTPSAG